MSAASKAIFLSILGFFFLHSTAFYAMACNLADHKWQLIGKIKFNYDSPLIPLSEISVASAYFTPNQVKTVYWLTKTNVFSTFSLLMKGLSGNWLAKLPWQSEKPANLSDKDNANIGDLVIKSDKYSLKIALFSDQNSNNNCYQIVLFEEGRIRTLLKTENKLDVKEFRAGNWFLIKFWETFSPQMILSISIYPIEGHENTFYENNRLAQFLLNEKLLKIRYEPLQVESIETFPGL